MRSRWFAVVREGQWKNGKRHGTGTLTGISCWWQGEWENDLQKDTEWSFFPGYGEARVWHFDETGLVDWST